MPAALNMRTPLQGLAIYRSPAIPALSTLLHKPVLLPATEHQGFRVFPCAHDYSQLAEYEIVDINTYIRSSEFYLFQTDN